MISACDCSSVAAAQQAALQTKIVMEVAAKQLDALRQAGAAVGQLLESVVQLGKALDRGTNLDLVA